MERWERTVDGAKDVWELECAGVAITERAGREGSAMVVREQRCDTEAMAEGIRARMVAQREKQGYARMGAPAEKKTKKGARPSYPGLDDAKLDEVIRAVKKNANNDAHRLGMAIYKVTADYQGYRALAWFLFAQGLVPAEKMPGLWDLLAEDTTAVDPAAVFALLAQMPEGAAFAKLFKYPPTAWWVAGSNRALDEMLFAAYQRDPALFDARRAELNATAQRALDFVRGRSGVALEPAVARALLKEFAEAQAGGWLSTNWEMSRVDGGAVTRPRLADRVAVREVALRFGTMDEWRAALTAAALKGPRPALRAVHDALLTCTATELATMYARAQSFGSNEELAFQLRVLEEERADPPEALLAAAEALRDGDDHARVISEMFAAVAARRFGERGDAAPAALVGLLRFAFFSGVYHESIRPYVAGLRALPREWVMEMADRALGREWGYGNALATVLAWPDDALLGRFFDADADKGMFDPEVVGRFGGAALPHLARVWELTPRATRRPRHQQILKALATAADRGEAIDPQWDRFVTFDEEGGESLPYWDESYGRLRERVLRGLPPERRAEVLRRAAERRWPERAGALVHVLDEESREELLRRAPSLRSG